ncbi:MAG: GNAT family acetyltransferase [Brooklawnia sp.]
MNPDELTAADRADAVTLWEQTGLTRPWNDPEADFTRAIEGTSSAVLGLRDDRGTLIGTAMVGHDGHRGWVYYLAVAPAEQSRGHGRQLMEACERWVIARSIPKIQLMVRTGNQQVIAFYTSLGYEHQDIVVLGRRLDGNTTPSAELGR